MEDADMKIVMSKPEFSGSSIQEHEVAQTFNLAAPGLEVSPRASESEDNCSLNALSSGQSNTGLLEQEQSPVEDASFSEPPLCPAPLCRQFWKAGNYDDIFATDSRVPNSRNYLHVHPKFLHSNATSHKWAFGAIAELLDNAVDEIQNGATLVILDKISNPRDKSSALLIQDDGGGMSPEAIRRCMSFGFSDKISKSAIGRYGNGFKTSTMRLGADAIVFTRRMDKRSSTQSIGLLSYTYLSCTGLDRIVVPMVDYEFFMATGNLEPLHRNGRENFESNISLILKWSPYSTEEELLKQFDDIGSHGTKVIIYNLWFSNDGTLEFDFDSDPEDIRLQGSNDPKKIDPKMLLSEQHIGNQYRYSLRVYLSILYLQLPQNFSIILRGKVVEHRRVAHDLKFPEFIVYRPQTGGTKEGEIITIIGFLKEAPDVNVHGFNVYHKNRLILPFWQVVSYCRSRGRGVVGVLEANFVEPIHNKQDFERTSLFQKLETRLKDMTLEYWDHHCGLLNYLVQKKIRAPVSSLGSSGGDSKGDGFGPTGLNNILILGPDHQANPPVSASAGFVVNSPSTYQQQGSKRTHDDLLPALGKGRRRARAVPEFTNAANFMEVQPATYAANQHKEQNPVVLMQENKKLRAKCLGHEKTEEELNHKISQLRKELEYAHHEYGRMLSEVPKFEVV